MCPRHVGGRYPTPGFNGEGVPALSRLPFDTHDLTQRMTPVRQIALRFHHGVDGLVSHRRFVDNVRILTTLDTGGCFSMIIQREATLRFRTRHGAARSMATAHEAFRITLAAHNVRARSHTAGNNSHVTLTPTHRSLTSAQPALPLSLFPAHLVFL